MTDVGGNDAETWALSAQNFLICLEMLLFSIAHFYCFPTEEWEEGYRANFNKSKFGDSIALGDFLSDIKLIMKGNNIKKKKKKKKKEPSEPTVPEGDEESAETGAMSRSELDYDDDDDDDDDEQDRATEDNSSVTSDTASSLAHANGTSSSNSDSREIEEARNRLLQSGLLNEMLFIEPRHSPTGSETLAQEESARWPSTPSTYGATDPKTPTERTVLLASSTPLRPSIFTTIAALSMQEEKELEKSSETATSP